MAAPGAGAAGADHDAQQAAARAAAQTYPAPQDPAKLQAMLGGAKQQETVVVNGKKDETIELGADDFDTKKTLFFSDCEGCTVTLSSTCTKVFADRCKNTVFNFADRVLTETVELYKCDDCTVNVTGTKVGTLQLDLCGGVTKAHYKEQDQFFSVVWAGVDNLEVSFEGEDADKTFKSGFDEMAKIHPDLHRERGQFILRRIAGSLLQEKVIRLANGFPSTQREADEFDARQEANLQKLAERAGIKIGPAKTARTKKIPPNSICPLCDSGKKYKKCGCDK